MTSKGSIWRKWDLQVGTKDYTRYTGVQFTGEKLSNLCDLTGLNEQQINGNHKDLSNDDYAKLFVEHFIHYNDTDVISLANHNTGEGIEEILSHLKLRKAENQESIYTDKFIFPGIEIGGNDRCHIIIVFNPETNNNRKFEFQEDGRTIKRELSWKEYIDRFLDAINIPSTRFNNGQPVNSSSLGAKDIISKSKEWDFIPVFPHIENSDGLWKELQDSNKKEIYSNDNFGIVDIPLTSKNQDLKRVCSGNHSSWGDKCIAVINTSDSESLEKIGSKFSYIKGDPSIKGLKHLYIEPIDRVRTGKEPEILDRVKLNRTKYLKKVKINQISSYTGQYGNWFQDLEIPLNPELVAIIGNKGSGKSALADIIALCGNYKNQDDFSFLHKNKFRDGKHAKNFEATITWESESSNHKNLGDSSVNGELELVKYLPQGYFERLTNEISSIEEFRKEIENVVFTHLSEDDKVGYTSFEELINSKKELINHEINNLKDRLQPINSTIFEKEKKLNTSYKNNIIAQIAKKKEELTALVEPIAVPNPNEDLEIAKKNEEVNNKIAEIKNSIEKLEQDISNETQKKQLLLTEINDLKRIKQLIKGKEEDLDFFKETNKESLSRYDLEIDEVVKYRFNYSTLDLVISNKESTLKEVKIKLGEEPPTTPNFISFNNLLKQKKEALNTIQKGLGEEEKKYQQYLIDTKNWQGKKDNIIGNENSPNTLKYFEKELKYVDETLKSDIDVLRTQRLEISKLIFDKMKVVLDVYIEVKTKIDDIISENGDLLDQYRINIEASFDVKANFVSKFLNYISLNKVGTFYGKENADIQIEKILENRDFNEFNSLEGFLKDIVKALFEDLRQEPTQQAFVENQVTEVTELYDYLFSLDFLDYNYELRQGDKRLELLSPGEKGALLLIFYLLLDNNDIPLIIDQPEDNLDNNSVANILVPFIKKAKCRRQIILVTHNPNLAVVADAEQVIYVELDKENNITFSFKSGAIENPTINESIVKVLEGTMPAFNKRKLKYYEN
ncbi:TrlF family AAA-like ATPase [Christiangramia sp. LLG6405-1]|uniref:TrlF family AAA-like ATPase n=1 Tax=Christiangramia sp. LLG6405-1 TaxID=3160832 RepID=UPI0038654E44